MKIPRIICLLIFLVDMTIVNAGQKDEIRVVAANAQVHFPSSVPAGNYSGITPLGNDRYAVVDDKSDTDGFYVFHIRIDSVSGQIADISNEGFRSNGGHNRDGEGITLADSMIWISGEADNLIKEYDFTGMPTGRQMSLPSEVKTNGNYGMESLSWHPSYGLVTATENPVVILQAGVGEDSLHIVGYYPLDAMAQKQNARIHMQGVSELLWLDDGSLMVLEREVFVPKAFIGAWTKNSLYHVSLSSQIGNKQLVCQWTTHLNLTARSFANYEGMCFGPKTKDGKQVLILVADSQNQYRGVLKDYFKTLVLDIQ